MTQRPTAAVLFRRPECRIMSDYLRQSRPDHPPIPGHRLVPFFPHFAKSMSDEDDISASPEALGTSGSATAETSSEAAMTSASPRPVQSNLLETMACLWMLSLAVDQEKRPLSKGPGLRCLTFNESAKIELERLRDALRFMLRPDQATDPANMHLPDVTVLEVPRWSGDADSTKAKDKFSKNIQAALMLGQHIFLCCRKDEAKKLPGDISPFLLQSLALPAMTPNLVYALHSLAHPAQPGLRPDELPDQDEVTELSLWQCALAVALGDQKPVLETIRTVLVPDQTEAPRAMLTLDDLVGNHGAVTLGRQIVKDHAVWARGELDWPEIANGIFLYGPPGCGKTVLAQALAGSLGVELFMLSYADAIKSSAGGSTDSRSILSNLTEIAGRAKKSGNAVVFIDEIEALGRSRFLPRDHNSTFYGTLTASLLRICDDLRASPGVILIAATNIRDEIDPAVLRMGRFDHHIALTPPYLRDIEVLLSKYLPRIPAEDISGVARTLVGCSFAEIATVAKHTRAQARASQRDITTADLKHAVSQQIPDAPTHDTDQDLWRCALHEAGHVLMLYLRIGDLPWQARLQAHGDGQVSYNSPRLYTPSRLNDMIAILMGGRAAEQIVIGEISSGSGLGPGSDLQRATYFALCSEKNWHLSPDSDLVWQYIPALTDHIATELRARISDRLRVQQELACATLAQHKPMLLDLAQALLTHRELDRSQISEILAQHEQRPTANPDPTSPGPQAIDVGSRTDPGYCG